MKEVVFDMPQHLHRRTPRLASFRRAGLALAAAGVAVTAGEAFAIQQSRSQLDWLTLASRSGLGEGLTIGHAEMGHVFAEHNGFTAPVFKIFWDGDEFAEKRANFVDPHATASVSAIAADSNISGLVDVFGPIQGIAPDVSLILSGGFSGPFVTSGVGEGGFFEGMTNHSVAYALFAMTDQQVADIAAARLDLPSYQPATVVNLGFGSPFLVAELLGEDPIARICNAVATMTGATLVAGAGNNRDDPDVPGQGDAGMMPDRGTVNSPASAHNVISVAFADEDLMGAMDLSSEGPSPSTEWIFVADLLFNGSEFPAMPPEFQDATMPEVMMSRTGVDITAPGTLITLLDSPDNIFEPRDPNAFNIGWFGSSFASAMVAGAALLIHDIGIREGIWSLDEDSDLPRPHWTVTKAILLNAADKERLGWNGSISEGMGDDEGICVNPGIGQSTATLDPELGAGFLDLGRVAEQLRATEYRDIRPDEPFNIDDRVILLDGFTREINPDPGDPEDRFREPPPLPRNDAGQVVPLEDMMNPPEPTDAGEGEFLFDFETPTTGTDPEIPFVTFFVPVESAFDIRVADTGFSGTLPSSDPAAPSTDAPALLPELEAEAEPALEPAAMPAAVASMEAAPDTEAPLGARFRPNGQPVDPDLGLGLDGDPDLGSGDRIGGGGTIFLGASPSDSGADGGGGGATQIKTGWDHGRLGVGHIDFPLGVITPNSEITATLCWERIELWSRLQFNTWAFDEGSGAAVVDTNLVSSVIPQGGQQAAAPEHPTGQIAFAQEDFDLELFRIGAGQQPILVAKSESVRENVEHIFIGGDVASCGGDFDDDVPILFAEYFLRVRYRRTLFDFGGFRWATGIQSLQQQHETPAPGTSGEFRNLYEAEAQFGLAWRVELATNVGQPVPFSTLALSGDVDDSGTIDAGDIEAFLPAFGTSQYRSDLNQDGVVNAADLGVILRNFGQNAADLAADN